MVSSLKGKWVQCEVESTWLGLCLVVESLDFGIESAVSGLPLVGLESCAVTFQFHYRRPVSLLGCTWLLRGSC